MLGRRELVAAAVAALMAALAVFGLAGLDDGKVVEVRVQGGVPTLPDMTRTGDTSTTSAPVARRTCPRSASTTSRCVPARPGRTCATSRSPGTR